MLRHFILILLVAISGQTFAYEEKLKLGKYPSTYLQECEGIAYIYKANKTIKLGVRAVKNCGRIKINDHIYKLEKYALGFRFERELAKSKTTRVSLFSKRGSRDSFTIESAAREHHRQVDRREGQTRRSLMLLKACSNSFRLESVKEYCHEVMRDSQFDVSPIITYCAQKPGTKNQKRCLDDSRRFTYMPVDTMKMCNKKYPMGSSYRRCIESAVKYNVSAAPIINQCSEIYAQNSKSLACIDTLSTQKNPNRHVELLNKCAESFFRSDIEQCYQKAKKINRRTKKTIEACSQSFPHSSGKLKCISSAGKVQGRKPDMIVKQCAESHFQAKKRLSCIERFY